VDRKSTVVIAEDFTILREGLRQLLSESEDLEVIGEAKDGLDAIRCVNNLKPDLVLMDLSMPGINGLEAIREIRKQVPTTRILVLTVHNDEEYVRQTLRDGADGYMLKKASQSELFIGIRAVLKGTRYLGPGVVDKVIDRYADGKRSAEPKTAWETLTAREQEILKLVGEGHRNKEIAKSLGISVKTTEKHRANLMRKLNLHSTSALTSYAISKGLVSPQ
jgi:two-component system, NarL family, response regulator NreC